MRTAEDGDPDVQALCGMPQVAADRVPVDVMYYQMQALISCQLRVCATVLKEPPCEAALARLTLDCSRCLLGEPVLMLRPRAGGGDWLALQCAGDRSGRILACIPACAALNLGESQRGNAHAWCQALVLNPANCGRTVHTIRGRGKHFPDCEVGAHCW